MSVTNELPKTQKEHEEELVKDIRAVLLGSNIVMPDKPERLVGRMKLGTASNGQIFDQLAVLTQAVDWLEMEVGVAAGVVSNLEKRLEHEFEDKYLEIPKAEGTDQYRKSHARKACRATEERLDDAQRYKGIMQARLRGIQAQLKEVEQVVWAKKNQMI